MLLTIGLFIMINRNDLIPRLRVKQLIQASSKGRRKIIVRIAQVWRDYPAIHKLGALNPVVVCGTSQNYAIVWAIPVQKNLLFHNKHFLLEVRYIFII